MDIRGRHGNPNPSPNPSCWVAIVAMIRCRHGHWRRAAASAVLGRRLASSVGAIQDGFLTEAVHEFPEHHRTLIQMRHLKTNAPYLHVKCSDPNRTMAILFRTPPSDNTGVAHILEHNVLCGSKQFPVRDPFFHMLRRSLHTFMNAMTGPDYTVYPFSTCHGKDFDNLLQVYCDAVFQPLLRPDDFRQEGVRFELNHESDPDSGLVLKGVVYNEMKGAMSDPSSILYREIYRRLLPDTPYRFNSGGDPLHIPDLTHEQLVAFHRQHYHPSNAKFFSYGNFDPPLAYLNEKVLDQFGHRPDLSNQTEVPLQRAWPEPRPMQEFYCPPESMPIDPEKQSTFTKSFLLPDVHETDAVTLTGLSLMSSLLLSGADSPFHKALIVPNIGSGYSPMTGLSGGKQALWSVGLQGMRQSDHDRVHNAISKTLTEVRDAGFSAERIDAIMHQYRLDQQEMKTDMGLQILYRILNRWLHGGDVESILRIESHLHEITNRIQKGPYMQDLIQRHLLDNRHTLCTLMKSDPNYLQQRSTAEQAILERTVLDPAMLVNEAQQLAQSQNKQEDASCLPTLTRNDIEPESPVDTAEIEIRNEDRGCFHRIAVDTNGLAYVKVLLDTDDVPVRVRPLLGVFSRLVMGMGAADLSYQDMSRLRMLYTGGASVSLQLHTPAHELGNYVQGISFQSSALSHNAAKMIDLLLDSTLRPRFDDLDRLRQLLKSQASSIAESVVDSGHAFARMHSASHHSPCLSAQNAYNGLDHAVRMATLAAQLDDDSLLKLSSDLQLIAMSLRLVRTAITESDTERIDSVQDVISSRIPDLADPDRSDLNSCSSTPSALLSGRRNFVAVPLDAVNNVALSFATDVPYSHEDRPALQVLARILSTEFLHRELREKGGAYGGGATHSVDGAFSFYSYRDPHFLETIEVFSQALQWCQDSDNITDARLNQALLSLFGHIDAPKHPSSHGQLHFCAGIAPHIKREYRQRLLNLKSSDVIDVAKRYFGDSDLSSATMTVVGNQDDMEQAEKDPTWHTVHLADLSRNSEAESHHQHSTV